MDGGVQTSGMFIAKGEYTFTGGTITGSNVTPAGQTSTGKLLITGGQTTMNTATDFVNGILMSGGSLTLGDDRALGAYDGFTVIPGTPYEARGQVVVAGGSATIIVDDDRTIQNRVVIGDDNASGTLSFDIAAGKTLTIDGVDSQNSGSSGAIDITKDADNALSFTGGGNLVLSNNTAGVNGVGGIHAAPAAGDVEIDFSGLEAVALIGNKGDAASALLAKGESAKVTLGNTVIITNNDSTSGASGSTVRAEANSGNAELVFGETAVLSRNTATGEGGGASVFSTNGTVKLVLGYDGTVTGNVAEQGGGLSAVGGTGAQVSLGASAIVSGNKATQAGGGVYTSHDLALSGNTLFSDNQAGTEGGALYMAGKGSNNTLTLNANTSDGDIAFTGNTDTTGSNSVHLEQNTQILLNGNGAVYFDDAISSGATGGNSLSMTGGGMVQFVGDNALNNGGTTGSVQIPDGIFRVVSGSRFTTGNASGQTFTVGSDGTLAGGGSITAGGFVISGTLSPDNDRFTVPANLSVSNIPTVAQNMEIGTLNLNGAVLFSGATLNIDLNALGQSDTIEINGAVSYGAAASEKIALSEWNNGTCDIMTATGGGLLAGNYDASRVTLLDEALHSRQNVIFNVTTGATGEETLQMVLTANNLNLVWNGGTGEWNYANTTWKDGENAPIDFVSDDYAIFTSANPGAVTVQEAGISTTGMQIAGGTYTFAGGSIKGVVSDQSDNPTPTYNTGRLDVIGGNATFTNEVLFANGVDIVSGGAVTLADGGNFGGMAIDNDGSFTLAHDSDYTQSGVLSGSGTTSKTGLGHLDITGHSSSTGLFVHNSGSVKLTGSWAGNYTQTADAGLFTAGAIGTNVAIGKTLTLNGSANIVSTLSTGSLEVGSGAHLDFALRSQADYGKILSSGPVNIGTPETVSLNLGSWTNGTYDSITSGVSMGNLSKDDFGTITVGGMAISERQNVIITMAGSDNNILQVTLDSGDNVNINWTGNAGPTWDTSTKSWDDGDPIDPADTFAHGAKVYFGGNGGEDTDITVAGNVTVSGMVVTGDEYTFTGGSITGTMDTVGSQITPTGKLEIDGGQATFSDIGLDFVNGVDIKTPGSMVLGDDVSLAENMNFNVDGKLTFDQNKGSTFGNSLTGDGTTTFTGDGSAFTGLTDVNKGTFIVNGDLGGNVQVNGGGTLMGNKSIGGNVDVNIGGTLSAGDMTSTGTLAIGGNLTMAAGSFYDVKVNPSDGSSTFLAITGTADLGGATVRHIGFDGTYNPIGTWTILTADGGLGGTRFDEHSTSIYAFLDPALLYDPDDHWVKLHLTRKDSVSFPDYAESGNQGNVASGLENSKGTPIYNEMLTSGADANIADVYDQLSGEMHATLGTLVMNYERDFQNVFRRGRFSGCERLDGYPIWASLDGYASRISGDGNAARSTLNGAGVSIGGDFSIGNNWITGGAFRFADTDVKVDRRYSRADLDSYGLGVYAAGRIDAWRPTFGATYGHHSVKSRRQIVQPGLAQQLMADYSLNTMQVFGEIGHEMMLSCSFSCMPYLGLSWNRIHSGGYYEAGGTAALAVES